MTFSQLFELMSPLEWSCFLLGLLVGLISYFGEAKKRRGATAGLGLATCVVTFGATGIALAAADFPIGVGGVVWLWMLLVWAVVGISLGRAFPTRLRPALRFTLSPVLWAAGTLLVGSLAGDRAGVASLEAYLVDYLIVLGALQIAGGAAALLNQFRVYRLVRDRQAGRDLRQTYATAAAILVPVIVGLVWIWVTVIPAVFGQGALAQVAGFACLAPATVDVCRNTMRLLYLPARTRPSQPQA